MPRTIVIEATWRSTARIEVADDWEAPDEGALQLGQDIDGEDIADQIDTTGAELVDWTVK
jgi:hypothetical protein